MKEIFVNLLKQIEDTKITVTDWLISFISILFVRFILESLSSPTLTGIAPIDFGTLTHYSLYFLTVSLGTIIILGHHIKDYKISSKLVLFGLPLIWLAPIIDILLSKGEGFRMLYIFHSGQRLLLDFFTFFGSELTKGATIGIRVVILISLIGISYIVYYKTNSIYKSIKNFLLIYLFVFIFATLPGIIFSINNNFINTNTEQIVNYFEKTIVESNILYNTVKDGEVFDKNRLIELLFNKYISQILFLISAFLSIFLFYKLNREKFIYVIENGRIERINFYITSLVCGAGFAYLNGVVNKISLIDVYGLLILMISWTSLWMSAVHLNDIYDEKIDKISNKERPLVQQKLNVLEMKDIGNLWTVVGLTGAYTIGYYSFFFAIVYLASSYIYSSNPLRLRRFPLIPSFLIGIASLSTILSGYFFISANKNINSFPILLAIGIITIVTLAINFKDIKDIEGDRENNILTIPNMFPIYGIKITGILFALSMLLVPIFLSFYLLFIISIPCSIIGYKIVTKTPYNEKNIFKLRFIFVLLVTISYLCIFYLINIYK